MRTTLVIAGLMCMSSAHAATIQVAPLGSGGCHIRNAIQAANTNANVSSCVRTGPATEPDTINMPAGAFGTPLASDPPYDDEDANGNGDLDITSAIVIQGVGVKRTQLAAPDADRLFDVRSGGSLTVRDMTLYGGSVVVSDTPFGGAIRKVSGGTLSLQRVVVRGGTAARGGGIYVNPQVGSTSLRDVTIFDAFASALGGGMAVESGGASALTELVNVTISGNASPVASGVSISFSPLRMRSTTVAFNRSTTPTGAAVIYNGNSPAQTIEITNSILTDNTNSDGSSGDLLCSTGIQLALRSHSIIGNIQSCSFATTTSTPAGTQPRLLPLFDYGGGIPMHALGNGSAAFNAGLLGGALGCVNADARGVTRFNPCDVGAYEDFFDEMIDSTADLPDLDPGDGLCRATGDVCTLRAATMEANALGGRWFVGLPPGTYVLSRAPGGTDDSGGDLDIRPVSANTPPIAFTLFGLGTPANTHIVGGGAQRVLDVRGRFELGDEGLPRNRPVSFALFNATVRNGSQALDNDRIVPAQERTAGGGINQVGGHSLFYNVVVRDNQLRALSDQLNFAQGAGVGVTLSRRDNDSYRYVSSAHFERFAVLDNLGFGDNPAVNTVTGGGIYAFGSDDPFSDGATFINGTIAGNQADTGAGIYVEAKVASSFLTIHDNFVAADTIANLASPGVAADNDGLSTFLNTIIAGNRFGALPRDCMVTLTSLGRILIGNDTGCTVAGDTTSNLLNVNPLLGTRQTAADGMPFHRLNQSSPALDVVPFNRCSNSRGQGLRTDALGAARPAVAATPCDLGAIEGAATADLILANGFESG